MIARMSDGELAVHLLKTLPLAALNNTHNDPEGITLRYALGAFGAMKPKYLADKFWCAHQWGVCAGLYEQALVGEPTWNEVICDEMCRRNEAHEEDGYAWSRLGVDSIHCY